jgi:hypothetical protein
MGSPCYRCHETLTGEEPFCAHCGAPQLCVPESETVLSAQEGSLQHTMDQAAGMLRWRAAVHAALIVALPAALLSALLSPGTLWVFAGGFFTVALYRRRTASPTNGKLGWRIGGLMGIIAASLSMAIQGASLVFDRFVLHQSAKIDSQFQTEMQSVLHAMQQQNPDFSTQMPWFSHFMLTPYGIAAVFLAGSLMLALSMVLFSALGGAIGGRYLRTRPLSRSTM